jgi:hypothetical protein
MTNYIDFMRKVEGKPERVIPVTPPPEYTYSGPSHTVHCNYLRDALYGDHSLLSESFTWRHTPQGHDYWSVRCGGLTALLSEDEQYLLWLLEEYNR